MTACCTAIGMPTRRTVRALANASLRSWALRREENMPRAEANLRRASHRAKTAPTPWADTVAMAAPTTPRPKPTMRMKSRITFAAAEKAMMARGPTESPCARRNAHAALRRKSPIEPRETTSRYAAAWARPRCPERP